jgi:TRAP-type C4-dicarboxylate transport system substrate-binding protein
VLERAAGGSADRLAGYAANVNFWIDEAEHCLRVIDGYEDRFIRFQEAQQGIVASRGPMKWDERGWRSPSSETHPTSTPDDLKRARRRVVGAMAKFLDRCVKEQMIDQKQRQAAAARVR